MTRAVGFALLLFGFIAPLVAPFCAADCQMMQSSNSTQSASFDDAMLPCCAVGQTAVVPPMQVQPQTNYHVAVDLHAPVAANLFREPMFVALSPRFENRSPAPCSAITSAVLRV